MNDVNFIDLQFAVEKQKYADNKPPSQDTNETKTTQDKVIEISERTIDNEIWVFINKLLKVLSYTTKMHSIEINLVHQGFNVGVRAISKRELIITLSNADIHATMVCKRALFSSSIKFITMNQLSVPSDVAKSRLYGKPQIAAILLTRQQEIVDLFTNAVVTETNRKMVKPSGELYGGD